MAQLRLVFIPHLVGNMDGNDPMQSMADFDLHYKPDDDHPGMDASVRGNADAHHSDLKRKADGISRSLSKVLPT